MKQLFDIEFRQLQLEPRQFLHTPVLSTHLHSTGIWYSGLTAVKEKTPKWKCTVSCPMHSLMPCHSHFPASWYPQGP